MQKIAQTMSSVCPLIAAMLLTSPGLSGYQNSDIHTYSQDEAAPARLISFSFFPGESAGAVGDFALSLEGLYLTGQGDPDGFTLFDEGNRYWVSSSADGWYAVELVKRYLSQDLEVWVDGIPVFLSEALEVLDPLLELDEVMLESDGYPALLHAVEAESLYLTPASIFDLDYVAPERLEPVLKTSPVLPAYSLKAPGRANGLKIPVDIPVAASAGGGGGSASESPPDANPACSGLFTPLF